MNMLKNLVLNSVPSVWKASILTTRLPMPLNFDGELIIEELFLTYISVPISKPLTKYAAEKN